MQLYHMEKDLHITDQEYLIALTIFFFSYAIFEVRVNPGHPPMRGPVTVNPA